MALSVALSRIRVQAVGPKKLSDNSVIQQLLKQPYGLHYPDDRRNPITLQSGNGECHYNRDSGKATGVTDFARELAGKRLELVKLPDLAPRG